MQTRKEDRKSKKEQILDMSRKHPLTTQTKQLFIVIRKTGKDTPKLEVVDKYCREYFDEYSYICHASDIDPVTAEVIPIHYHIVGRSNKSKTRLSTHLEDLTKFFKFENNHGIEIDKYDNYVKALQYLIHKNNPEKTQHKIDEVHTNIERNDLVNIMASESGEIISFDLVYTICRTSNNIVEVIKSIGFHTYHKYRNTIRDIWDYEVQRKASMPPIKEK